MLIRSDTRHTSMRIPPTLGNTRDLAKKRVKRTGRLFPRICGRNEKAGASCSLDSTVMHTVLCEAVFPFSQLNPGSLVTDITHTRKSIQFTLQPCFPRDQLISYSHHTGVSVGAIGDRKIYFMASQKLYLSSLFATMCIFFHEYI